MKKTGQQGQIIIIALVFFAVLLTMGAALMGYVVLHLRTGKLTLASNQALRLAEAGMEKAIYELNQDATYTGETNTPLGNGTFTVSVQNVNSTTRRITATGHVPNSINPTASKIIKGTISVDANIVSFRYGVQSGAGGFSLTGGSTINGNVYSNGNISATTGVHITGSATAANPPALAADQVNNTPATISSCTTSNCITFGNVTASQDFAQSFTVSISSPLNNIQFYIKKVSTPGNLTVRVVNDNSGSPGTDALLTGTLSASAVTTNFGWVTVTMPSTPVLDPGQTYWITLDGSTNSSRYYVIGANNTYANGTAKVGSYGGTWSNTSPSGLDGYFQIYLGGGYSMIGGNSYAGGVYVGTATSDNAWAHNVMGATVTGTFYCQTSSFTNKPCNTSQADPPPIALPLSDNNVQDWKDEATAGGVITGDYHVGFGGAILGPKKITGNLLVDGGGTLTVTGTLWITGNITLTSGGKIQLSPSYGANDGAIVTDGRVTLNGGSNFAGSGQPGSYPFLITTSACPAEPGCAGNNAITMSGGSGTVALVAQNGTVYISGGASLKAVTANQIVMDGGGTLYYDSGLVNANFTSGPGGTWSYVPGSYVIVK